MEHGIIAWLIIGSTITAFVGAVILLFAIRLFRRR